MPLISPQNMISRSKVAAVISDPHLPDNPIIACNDAFTELTGYNADEVIGRNCRFLRGDLTEPEAVAALRVAIEAREPVMVELFNYRKDNSVFRNAVMIAPLFDAQGEIRYFLGSQIAVDKHAVSRQEQAQNIVSRLTPRQKQVLEALATGQLNKQIAYDLSLTERTVKMHRAALLRALNFKTNADAIRIAIEAGL